jgi:predicted regulator of Ras-like GTPase activity (Roadblock/LC7/MglB family)
MNVPALLSTLRDVEGVMGSFVVDLIGQVRARDMPAMFDDGALQEAAPRIARLKEALETQGEQVDSVTLAHGPHSLFLRTSGELILCVLAPSEVSLPALRMGSSLVLRRLPEALASARNASTLPPTLRPPPNAEPGTVAVLPPPPPVPAVPPPVPSFAAPAVGTSLAPPATALSPAPAPAATPRATPPPVPPPVPPSPSGDAVKRPRFFRGRLIEDD